MSRTAMDSTVLSDLEVVSYLYECVWLYCCLHMVLQITVTLLCAYCAEVYLRQYQYRKQLATCLDIMKITSPLLKDSREAGGGKF